MLLSNAEIEKNSRFRSGLGGCPRIDILFKVEAFSKNKHSHMFDIASIVF